MTDQNHLSPRKLQDFNPRRLRYSGADPGVKESSASDPSRGRSYAYQEFSKLGAVKVIFRFEVNLYVGRSFTDPIKRNLSLCSSSSLFHFLPLSLPFSSTIFPCLLSLFPLLLPLFLSLPLSYSLTRFPLFVCPPTNHSVLSNSKYLDSFSPSLRRN